MFNRSGARRCALANTGGPVVRMWCVTLCYTGRSGCVTEGKSRRSAANSLAGSRDCKEGLGERYRAAISWMRSCISPSRSWWFFMFFMSTSRLKWCRKSAPRMGFRTSATMNAQENVRRRLRLRVSDLVP